MKLYEIPQPIAGESFGLNEPIWVFQDSFNPEEAYIGIYKNDLDDVKAHVFKFSNNFWRLIVIPKNKISKRKVSFDEELFNLRRTLIVNEQIKFELPNDRLGNLRLTNGSG